MFECNVPGTPTPQGSKRAFVVGGRAVVTESAGEKLKIWRAAVAAEVQATVNELGWELLEKDPCYVTLTFTLKPAKADPKWWVFHRKRPDLDKLIRAVLDELSGRVFTDDSQVAGVTATKTIAWDGATGVHVHVAPLVEEP